MVYYSNYEYFVQNSWNTHIKNIINHTWYMVEVGKADGGGGGRG